MRERRPGDWRVDLARRSRIEGLVEQALDDHPTIHRLSSSTDSMDRLDFQVLIGGDRYCQIELKAKNQPYQGWGDLRPDVHERDLFILDELSIRKLASAGRYACLLIHDRPGDRWIVWSLMDLIFATKTRVSRRLATATGGTKAKVLLDLTDTDRHHQRLGDALDSIVELVERTDRHWNDTGPWDGRYLHLIGAA